MGRAIPECDGRDNIVCLNCGGLVTVRCGCDSVRLCECESPRPERKVTNG